MRRFFVFAPALAAVLYACGGTATDGGSTPGGSAAGSTGATGGSTVFPGFAGSPSGAGAKPWGSGGTSTAGHATSGGSGGSVFGAGGGNTTGGSPGAAGAPTGTGGTTSSGGSPGSAGSPTQGGGGSPSTCDASAGVSACNDCCFKAHPSGANAYSQDVGNCACAGACTGSCTQDCQAGQLSTQSCDNCLNQAFGSGSCQLSTCGQNADCQALVACFQACQNGSTTGGGGTTGSGGSPSTGGSPGSGGSTTGGEYACPGDDGDPFAPARIECVKTINMYRATIGLPAYGRWCGIQMCTDTEPQKDAAANTAHSAFGQCGEWAQDECPGWPDTPLGNVDGCLQQMWAEGPGPSGCASDPNCFEMHGHYINMSSTMYSQVECGFYETGGGSWWGVQDFH